MDQEGIAPIGADSNPPIISRKEAKALGLKRYFTGVPCPHGHMSERRVPSGACTACEAGRTRQWQARNPDKVRAKNQHYYRTHTQEERLRHKAAQAAKKAKEYAAGWFVYMLRSKIDGLVFYIGSSKDKFRFKDLGLKPSFEIVAEGLDKKTAREIEQSMIAYLGNQAAGTGPLVNIREVGRRRMNKRNAKAI
jgi:hypothetical protein